MIGINSIILFVIIFYFGWVVGLVFQCENIPLKHAKRIVLSVPILMFAFSFQYLFECLREKRLKRFIAYLKSPGKGIIILGCYEHLYNEKKSRKVPIKKNSGKITTKSAIASAKPLLLAIRA